MILFEQWAGHRLPSEKVTRPRARAHCPVSVSSVPVSEGIEFRQECRFMSSLAQPLEKLPENIGRHLFRLRHLGWDHHQCLKAVCGVWWVSSGWSCGAFGCISEAPSLHHPFSGRLPLWCLT